MAINLQNWAVRQRAPFTLFLVASLIGFALLSWITQDRAIEPLALSNLPAQPWSLLTYPWAYSPLGSPFGLVFLIFMSIWLTQYGGTVERQTGTARFALFWVAFTIIPGLVAAAMKLPLAGPWLPGSAVIIAWCASNRSATIMLYCVLPIKAMWMAALTAATILFVYGSANPILGIFMAAPLGLAWLFGGNQLPIAFEGGRPAKRAKITVVRGGTAYDEGYFENVKDREIEREERERLRKLFEGK